MNIFITVIPTKRVRFYMNVFVTVVLIKRARLYMNIFITVILLAVPYGDETLWQVAVKLLPPAPFFPIPA